MATAAWPSWARLRATDYELGAAPTVARTEFDDGAVRQVRRTLRPVTHRTVVAEIPGDRLVEFRTWAEQHAHTWFRARDLDGSNRPMRVAGGVGGITYRQAARRAGRAWWDASLTLEDAPVASLAFPVASLGWTGRPGDLPLALPIAYGGLPPYTYRLTPALPGSLALDAGRRIALSSPPADTARPSPTDIERFPIRTTAHTWMAEDAAGAEASIPVTVTVWGFPVAITAGAAAGGLNVSPAAFPTRPLPSTWFAAPPPSQNSRRLRRTVLNANGQVEMRIGPVATQENLIAAVARDLRLRWSATVTGTTHVLTVVGPQAATATRRDADDPYVWTPPNTAEIAAFVAAVPDGAAVTLDYWLAAPP